MDAVINSCHCRRVHDARYMVGRGATDTWRDTAAHAVAPNDETAVCGEPLSLVQPLRSFEEADGQCQVCLEKVLANA